MTTGSDELAPADLLAFAPRLALALPDGGEGGVAHEIDSSLVFVDLSGFTAMSERLARRGRVGSEEVTEVVSTTFGDLLAVAWAAGGGLLKFGGDALLLAFTGPGHPARAAHAAVGMRRSLRAMGAIGTSAGAVRLRMSVGVHSGPVLYVLAGTTSRELFVVGPGATATVAAEHDATAGKIVLSAGATVALPTRVVGPPLGEGVVLARDPGPNAVPPVPGPRDGIDPGTTIPVAVRQHLSEGGGAGEHRQAGVAFVRVTGVDDVAVRLGPAAVADRLHLLTSVAQEAAAEAGICLLGNDIDVDGCKLILTGGVPIALGDDEDRLVHAVRRIVDADCGLVLRAGVHAGPLFAGIVGPTFRRTYTVMGDAVNTAARVMARAAPAEVLVTGEVLSTCTTSYATTATEPFTAKGKRRPIVAHRIDFHAGAVGGSEEQSPMSGRQDELASLLDAIDAAVDGRGVGAVVVAARGAGATRLMVAAEEGHPARPWVTVRVTPTDNLRPYAVAAQLLRPLLGLPHDPTPNDLNLLVDALGAIHPDLERWATLIGPLVGVHGPATPAVSTLEPRARGPRVQAVVLEILAAVPATVLVVDHVGSTDAATLRLLHAIAPALAQTRVALVSIGAEAPPWSADEIILGRLPDEDIAALVRTTAKGRLSANEPSLIAVRAEGNPRLAVELTRAVLDGTPLDALPAVTERLVAARLDRLPLRTRDRLRTLSVLGTSCTIDDARTVAGVDDDTLRNLVDLLQVDEARGIVRFRSRLVRDVAYEGLSRRRRAALHGRAAAVLELDGERAARQPDVLSVHHVAAGNAAAAWRWSALAAEQAWSAGAWIECAAACRRGLAVSGQSEVATQREIGRAWERLGRSSWATGDVATAERALRRAQSLLDDAVDVASVLFASCLAAVDLGRDEAALRRARRGLRLLREHAAAAVEETGAAPAADAAERMSLEVRLLLAVVGVRYAKRPEEALALADEALAIAEAHGDIAGIAHAHHYASMALRRLGSAEAEARERAALAGYAIVGDLRTQAAALNGIGLTRMEAGDAPGAVEAFAEAASILRRIGAFQLVAAIENNVGVLLSALGRYEEASIQLRRTVELAGAGSVYGLLALSNLAEALARSGHATEAETVLADARGLIGGAYEPDLRLAAVEVAIAKGDPKRGLIELEQLWLISLDAEQRGLALAAAGRVALCAGDVVGATAELHAALDELQRIDRPRSVALVLDALWRATGEDRWRHERDEVAARIGIVAFPVVPAAPGGETEDPLCDVG